MFRANYDAMIVESGQYGPFDDGSTYDYVRLSDGESMLSATCVKGLVAADLPKLVKGAAEVEVYENQQGKKKARLHSFTPYK